MNVKNLLLGIFVILTVVFASLTLGEYYQVKILNSQLQSQSKSTSTQTLTSTSTPSITTTSPVLCPINSPCASFTYNPVGQVKVDAVHATIYGGSARYVMFNVTVENSGNSPISFESYTLSATIATDSRVLRKVTNNEGFSISQYVTLNHGQNYTLLDPVSGDGYMYQLLQSGSVNVSFSLFWTDHVHPCSQAPCTTQPFSNSTTISALFVFA